MKLEHEDYLLAKTITENRLKELYDEYKHVTDNYNYYKKLGRCKYNIESDDEPTSLGRFH